MCVCVCVCVCVYACMSVCVCVICSKLHSIEVKESSCCNSVTFGLKIRLGLPCPDILTIPTATLALFQSSTTSLPPFSLCLTKSMSAYHEPHCESFLPLRRRGQPLGQFPLKRNSAQERRKMATHGQRRCPWSRCLYHLS